MVGGLVNGNRVVIYDPVTDQWEQRDDLELPERLLAPGAAIADGRLFVAGGGAPNVFNPTRATRVIVLPESDIPDDSEGNEGANDGLENENETESSADELHIAVDGIIAIEAEHAVDNIVAANRSWVSGNRGGSRANSSLIASPDTGLIRFSNNDTPHLRYQVVFPEAGSWRVWVRGWGDAVGSEGKSDSVHVGINGTLADAAAMQGFTAGGWVWSNSTRGGGFATVQVTSPGQQTIDVWMREDGFEIDALVLTLDGNYVPSGTGPAEHHADDSDGNGNTDAGGNDDAGSDADAGSDTGSDAGGDAGSDTGGAGVGNDGGSNADTGGNDGGSGAGTDGSATGGDGGTDSGEADAGATDGSNGGNGTGGNDDAGGNGNTAADNVIVMEAEAFTFNSATNSHAWIVGARNGSSGGSMITTPDAGNLKANAVGSPSMRYDVDFPTAGSWRVWVRGWGDAVGSEGKSDSVHVGINGTLDGAAAMQGFPTGGWAWSNSTRGNGFATVQVDSPGQHTIEVWMREDGLEIDALLFTTDTSYIPEGITLSGDGADSGEGTGNGPENGNGGDTEDNDADSQSRAPDTLDWVERSNSEATKRHEAGAVEFDGKLFLLGGRGSRPIDIYDPVADSWSKGASAPFEMHHFQPIALDGKIWVVGAMTCCYPREDNVSHVWTYSPGTDTWQQAAEIPEARRRGSAATVVRNGMIYLVGGNTLGHDGGAVSWFDEFNPSTGAWRVLPDAPVARDHAQGGLIDDVLVLAAGRLSSQPNVFSNTIARVDVYNFSTGVWNQGADIPTTRAGSMTVTVGREVLIIGGESAGRAAAHDAVEAYDVDTNNWRVLRPLSQGRHSGGAVRLADGVHVVAGATTIGGANETASHESLTVD